MCSGSGWQQFSRKLYRNSINLFFASICNWMRTDFAKRKAFHFASLWLLVRIDWLVCVRVCVWCKPLWWRLRVFSDERCTRTDCIAVLCRTQTNKRFIVPVMNGDAMKWLSFIRWVQRIYNINLRDAISNLCSLPAVSLNQRTTVFSIHACDQVAANNNKKIRWNLFAHFPSTIFRFNFRFSVIFVVIQSKLH